MICFSFKYESPDQEEGDSQQEIDRQIDRQIGSRTKLLKHNTKIPKLFKHNLLLKKT